MAERQLHLDPMNPFILQKDVGSVFALSKDYGELVELRTINSRQLSRIHVYYRENNVCEVIQWTTRGEENKGYQRVLFQYLVPFLLSQDFNIIKANSLLGNHASLYSRMHILNWKTRTYFPSFTDEDTLRSIACMANGNIAFDYSLNVPLFTYIGEQASMIQQAGTVSAAPVEQYLHVFANSTRNL